MSKQAKQPPKDRRGHKTSARDLVSVRSAKSLKALLPTKRRERLGRIYGYKA